MKTSLNCIASMFAVSAYLIPTASEGFATDVAAEAAGVRQPVTLTPRVVDVVSSLWAVKGSNGEYHLVYELGISTSGPGGVRNAPGGGGAAFRSAIRSSSTARQRGPDGAPTDGPAACPVAGQRARQR